MKTSVTFCGVSRELMLGGTSVPVLFVGSTSLHDHIGSMTPVLGSHENDWLECGVTPVAKLWHRSIFNGAGADGQGSRVRRAILGPEKDRDAIRHLGMGRKQRGKHRVGCDACEVIHVIRCFDCRAERLLYSPGNLHHLLYFPCQLNYYETRMQIAFFNGRRIHLLRVCTYDL